MKTNNTIYSAYSAITSPIIFAAVLVCGCATSTLAIAQDTQTVTAQDVTPTTTVSSMLYDRNGDGEIKILAFGDSITRGVGDFVEAGEEVFSASHVEEEAGYPLRIEHYLNVAVHNQGIPGERLLRDGLGRAIGLLTSTNPDIVVVLEGANDSIDRVSKGSYVRSLQILVNIASMYGTEPVIATIPPSCRDHSSLQPIINSYNEEIRYLVTSNGLVSADVYKAFSNTCDINNCYLMNLPEGLHPNIEGYDVIGEVITSALLNIDIFAPTGAQLLEQALNLTAGSIKTIPDPVTTTTPSA